MTRPLRTERGLDRFVTFVDAVVAIALTLLVLPLVDVATELDDGGSVGALLADHRGQFAAFALSFVVIARLWTVHHALFERVGGYDRVLVATSLVWLFTIVVLPFPTELLPAAGGRVVFALYVGNLTLSSLALAITAWHVARTPAVQRAGADDHLSAAPAAAATGLFAVALVVGLAVPAIGFWGLLLQFATGPVVRAWEHLPRRMA